MPQAKKPRRVVELSRTNRRLLEEICEGYGSRKEAHKDPNFVLQILLEYINQRKGSVSAMLSFMLDDIKPHVLEYYRERQQERRYKLPDRRKKAA
ncbi:MAG: hypothetical protein A3J55_04435 [Candidatus Ryanbacteria bacterium RIFCSPHIGHO2_02_FULL_45_17b]|uniref:Uncharacterized protein n=1 Tax=Candidatus Ryanbacteria bacterium RIFCSPHIGHO2_01_FULL_45_22 TaxID=1802114 RepID=A0A1G2G3G7_9BACT|nr:MAG: hypothetical protein A2719_05010 [Candidatus Ryanbacteria bacterium RIFCSPHIGHO2_01_FULL_45_22]OGZ47593.1 MAG: hypothetical protein A3J55_04435 [Candidatus Ryanbacteria bacterium RIFCSPHIGHO2_02_FULL_45_17b]